MAKASVRDGLWKAILADREDDLPRLAYADWCEENGDADRARFIRLQVEQAKGELYGLRWWELEEAIRPLWEANRDTWRGELPGWCRDRVWSRRGFPDATTGPTLAFARNGRALLRKQPIRSVALLGGDPVLLGIVLAWPEFAAVGELGLLGCQGDPSVAEALGQPHFRNLTALTLSLTPPLPTLQALATQPTLGNVRTLRWLRPGEYDLPRLDREPTQFPPEERHEPAEEEVAALMGGPWAGPAVLELGWTRIGPPEVAILASAPVLAGLEELDLHRNPLGLAGIEALTRANWPSLRRLVLDEVQLGGQGLARLLAWPSLAGVRWLSLRRCSVEGHRLASSRALRHLAHLHVRDNNLRDRGLAHLLDTDRLPALRSLDVSLNGITAAAFRPEGRALAGVERLALYDNPQFGDEGGRALLDSPHLGRLRWLDVTGCGLGQPMLEALRHRFPYVRAD